MGNGFGVRFKRRQFGFSLIEVTIALGCASLMAVSMSAVLQSVAKLHWRQQLLTTLATKQAEIITFGLNNHTAWEATLNYAANKNSNGGNMDCLHNNTPCNPGNYKFILVNGANQVLFDSLTAGAGFTLQGVPCAGYSTSGNSNCPISYNDSGALSPGVFTWSPKCPTVGKCINPPVVITAVPTIPLSLLKEGAINFNNYAVNSTRNANDAYEVVMTRYTPGSVAVAGSLEPSCIVNPATWGAATKRRLSASVPIGPLLDSGQNVISMPTDNRIVLKGGDTAIYECHVSAPAYQVGATKIALIDAISGSPIIDVDNNPAVGPGVYAPPGVPVTVYATLDVKFPLPNATTLSVAQTCATSSTIYDLGMPVQDPGGSYLNTVYTTLFCVRTN